MLTQFSPSTLRSTCSFGMCPELATRTVTTRTPIGRRVEALCGRHAARVAQFDQVLHDAPIHTAEPRQSAGETDQRYVLTQAGRDALARAEAFAWLFGPQQQPEPSAPASVKKAAA